MWNKDTYNFMEFVKGKCEMAAEADRLMNELPEGTLVVRQTGNKTYYYWQRQLEGKSKQKYLSPIKDIEIIEALQQKKGADQELTGNKKVEKNTSVF